MAEPVQRAIAWLLNRVRVNHVQQGEHDGTAVFIKRRRAGGRIVVWFANRFLELAHSGTCMFASADEWIAWEVHCAHLLYPERSGVKVGPGPSAIVPKVNGLSLRALLHRNDAGVQTAFVLAARELRRAHQLPCSDFNAAWSHGDLHLDNIVCDVPAGRAVLIDFDMRHERRIDQAERHGDDVKVVLLDLMRLPDERWSRLATTFVEAYGDSSVLRELDRQLVVPRGGFARLLWYVRTDGSFIEPRLQRLREILASAGRSSN